MAATDFAGSPSRRVGPPGFRVQGKTPKPLAMTFRKHARRGSAVPRHVMNNAVSDIPAPPGSG